MDKIALKFLELLEDSVIIQSLVTLGTVGAVVVMSVRGQPISEEMAAISYTIIGFWFGSKTQHLSEKAARMSRTIEPSYRD